MKLLQKRSSAIAVFIVIVVAFTILGMNRSISKAVKETEEMFYSGGPLAEGYTERSIDSQLAERMNAALGLVTLANNQTGLEREASAIRDARQALENADSISDKSKANIMLTEAVTDLLDSSFDSSSAAAQNYISSFNGAQTFIESMAYNKKVAEFEDSVLPFPLSVLRIFVFAGHAEPFA